MFRIQNTGTWWGMLRSYSIETTETAPLLQRTSLAEQIYRILEERIVSGELAPGEKMLEDFVAEAFGVSRSPAREALSALEHAGLVVRTTGRDRSVSVPTAKWINDAFEFVLGSSDSGCTYLSCLNAPESDHLRLYQLLDAIETAQKQADKERQERSGEFHELLKCRCVNRQLDAMIEQNAKVIQWFKALYFADLDFSEQSKLEHRKIVDCYVRKDLAGLLDAARKHLMRTRDRILAKRLVRHGVNEE